MATLEALERTVRELEARLRAVEDVAAIHNLKSRYGTLADSRYGSDGPVGPDRLDAIARELAALFTEDAEWDGGAALGTCRGRDAIAERFREPTLHFSAHYFVKPRISVEEDRAQGTWDILAPCTSREGRAIWMAGVEEDEYQRVDGVWLHRRMALSVVFMAPHDRGWARARPPTAR